MDFHPEEQVFQPQGEILPPRPASFPLKTEKEKFTIEELYNGS
jgi:hypothetical protein